MRLALITGGSRRLGAVIAAELARQGYALAIHGSHGVEPTPELQQVLSEAGTSWHGFTADFREAGAALDLMKQVEVHFGASPDLLVNNAAAFGQDRLETVTEADLISHFTVNCVAPAMLTQAFAAGTQAGAFKRSIVNIVDQRIIHPPGDQFAYTLSKMALAALTDATARALAPNIRVNAVAPGLTIASGDYTAPQTERLGTRMPLGELPAPQRIAEAVAYLAGAEATTGQTLFVDAGAHLISFERDFVHLDR